MDGLNLTLSELLYPLRADPETFFGGATIRFVPHWLATTLSVLTVLLAAYLVLRIPLKFAWLALAALAACWILVGIVLFSLHWLVPLATPLLCILLTYLVLLGHKVRRQEADQWRLHQDAANARQIDEFKNNFVSLFSHDLKTPIARIKAVVQVALADSHEVPAKLQDALKNIDRASDDLGRLIGDILKVTKMESMALELQQDSVDLNRTVELAVARLKYAGEEKKIRFVLDLEPLFPIEGDPQLIQEIVINLAENGVKYGKPGSNVTIRTAEEAGRVRVTVTDEGQGIPAEELPRVTGKFFRGKAAAKNSSGSGLGLYLAKYFVEMHQGGLDIQSQEGRGTQVTFWLPSPS